MQITLRKEGLNNPFAINNSMKQFSIMFVSDMHGNEEQYRRIFARAQRHDALILGGDICPKDTESFPLQETNKTKYIKFTIIQRQI